MKVFEPSLDLKLALPIMALSLVILGLHAYYYYPFIADDALISLRYSQRLADGHGLNWNPGERVEGYSNLLWVLCAALLKRLGVDLITAVRILGVAGMGAVVAATFYAYQPRSLREAIPVAVMLLFFSLAAPIAVWIVGGMEQPLVAALLSWAVALTYRRIETPDEGARKMLLPGLCFALLSVTRLDGIVFTGAAMIALLIISGISTRSLKRALALALLPFLFLAGQAIFRRAYYGEFIPNTALAKFVPSGKHSLDGWGYLLGGVKALSPLLLLAIASIVVSFKYRFMRSRVVLLCVLAFMWTAYVVVIGGDIFPAWRHFVPLVVLLTMLILIGAEWVGRYASRTTYIVSCAAALVLLLPFIYLQLNDRETLRARSERWEWDGQVIGLMLKKAFGPQQPLMAVDPAGCLPFWSELPSLDMLGLNDHYLPRHPPADLGQGEIGHELGDGKYVLDRKPDLVIFLLPSGNDQGYFRSGREMQQDPRFYQDYSLVWFEGREPYPTRSRIWVRRESERIGIRRMPYRIEVPGFLFSHNPATITYLDETGSLVVPATKLEPARIRGLRIPAGLWKTDIDANGGEAVVRMVLDGESTHTTKATRLPTLDSTLNETRVLDLRGGSSETSVTLEVSPVAAERIQVSRISLSRILVK